LFKMGILQNQMEKIGLKIKSVAEYFQNVAHEKTNKYLEIIENRFPMPYNRTKSTVLYFRYEFPTSVWFYRFFAWVWLVCLLYTAPWVLTMAAISWYTSRCGWFRPKTKLPQITYTLPENERKTVLITGCTTTKALHVARTMGQAGHKIIIADQDPAFGLSLTRFSKYVHKYFNVKARSKADYVEELVRIWALENIDWFIPISNNVTDIEVMEATIRMKGGALKTGREFNSLAVNLHTAKKIKDKIAFWNECTELDLKVPKYKIMPIDVATEIRNLKFQGFFGQRRRYVLKTLNTTQNEDDINVGNDFEQKPIPIEDSEFENYLRDLKISPDERYILSEYIEGTEYLANLICRDGEILIFQVCLKKHGSSWYNVSELNSTKNEIFEWVNSYVNSKKINGMLNFKFIESKDNGDVYCTQANPHIHSAIVNFHAKSEFVLGEPILQMMVLERVLRSALISEDTYMEKSEIVTPKSNTQVYWLYNELANLLTKQKKLHEVLSTFRNGQDAIWSSQDPLPFIALNYIQMPILLLKTLISGNAFHRLDFAEGHIK